MLVIKENDASALEIACAFLKEGKVISFGSDTIYGIAVDASNSKAVEALYKIKNRDKKKPIAIFLPDLVAAKKIFLFDKLSLEIAEKFLPGPLTMVLKIQPKHPYSLTSCLNHNEDNFLGFRIVKRDFVEKLLEKFAGNLAVTSANPSGETSSLSADEIKNYFKNSEIDLLIDGGISERKIASSVVKIDDGKITILRQGAADLTAYL